MTLLISTNTPAAAPVIAPTATSPERREQVLRESNPPVRQRLSDTSEIASFIADHRHDSSSTPTSAQNPQALLRSGFSVASDTPPVAVDVHSPVTTQLALEHLLQAGSAVHIPTAALTFNKSGYGAPTTLGFTSAILSPEPPRAFLDNTTGAQLMPLKLRVFDRGTFVDYPVVADLTASKVDVDLTYSPSHTSDTLQPETIQLLNFKIAVTDQGGHKGKNCSLLEIHLPANSILTPLSPVAATKDLEQFAAESGCVVDTTLHHSLKDYFTQLGIDASSYLHLRNEKARLRISIPKDGSEAAIITSFNANGMPVPIPQQLTNQIPSLSAEIVNKALGFEHGYSQRTGPQDPLHERWSKRSEVLAIPCKVPFTEAAQKIQSWCDTCAKAIDEFSNQEYHGNLRALLLQAHTDARREITQYANDLQQKLQTNPYMSLEEISSFLNQLQGLCETSLVPDKGRNQALADGRPTRLWYKTESAAVSLQVYRPQYSTVVNYTLSFGRNPERSDISRVAETIRTFSNDAVEIKAPFVEHARQALEQNEPLADGFSLTFQDLPTFAKFMISYDPRASILSEIPESILQMRQRQYQEGLRYLQDRADSVANTVRADGTILESQLIGAIEVLNRESGLELQLREKPNSASGPYDDQRFEFYDRESNLQLDVVRSWSSREITCNLRIDPENTPTTKALRQNSALSKESNVSVRSDKLEDITKQFFTDAELSSGPCYIRNVGNLSQTFLLLREIDR